MLKHSALREETLVTAMLCIRLPSDGALRPLTQSGFRHIADSLQREGYKLQDILTLPNVTLTSLLQRKAPLLDKISALRGRFRAVCTALDDWADKGIWVLGEHDSAYPDRLVRRLVAARPPLLFGCGPNGSLDAGGVCIVGSRNSSDEAIRFTKLLAERCAAEKMTVISSDMRGVDRMAIQSAAENAGRVLMVLSDKLEKAIAHPRFASALADGAITMVTPFAPDVGFSVGNAVRANRYQYALSDLAVIAETRSKGGIWQGVEENRKGDWVQAFVRSGDTIPPGNRALLHLGLAPITHRQISDAPSITQFFLEHRNIGADHSVVHSARPSAARALFRLFQTELAPFTENPRSVSEIAAHFAITSDQAESWIAMARDAGTVRKDTDKTGRWVTCSR